MTAMHAIKYPDRKASRFWFKSLIVKSAEDFHSALQMLIFGCWFLKGGVHPVFLSGAFQSRPNSTNGSVADLKNPSDKKTPNAFARAPRAPRRTPAVRRRDHKWTAHRFPWNNPWRNKYPAKETPSLSNGRS